MNICVVGTGYVGLVVGTCLADQGFRVVCVDSDAEKVAQLRRAQSPIFEPGLEELIRRNCREGRLSFDTDTAAGVAGSTVVFIAVGTPSRPDGSADLTAVFAVAEMVGQSMARPTTVVIKSTVPVGTADAVRERIAACSQHDFDVVSNPEFLKEGTALKDFSHPDRIVIGHASAKGRQVMEQLYAGMVRTGRPILFMDNRSAEMTKYASNVLLATRISFMNELAILCEKVGADIESVRMGTGSDPRIGPRFLFAGTGFGGSCFPKDIRALAHLANENGVDARITQAVADVNEAQKHVLPDKILARFGTDLAGLSFAMWGLAFKPRTDDVREAPALVIIERLVQAGARIQAYDPEANHAAAAALAELGVPLDVVQFTDSPYAALDGADALVLVTEWNEFRNPDLAQVATRLGQSVVFDGRNIFDPAALRAAGFEYHGIGRG